MVGSIRSDCLVANEHCFFTFAVCNSGFRPLQTKHVPSAGNRYSKRPCWSLLVSCCYANSMNAWQQVIVWQVSTRHIINKLFFDIGGEEEGGSVDPENLQVSAFGGVYVCISVCSRLPCLLHILICIVNMSSKLCVHWNSSVMLVCFFTLYLCSICICFRMSWIVWGLSWARKVRNTKPSSSVFKMIKFTVNYTVCTTRGTLFMLCVLERDCRDKQKMAESLKQTAEKLKLDTERLKKEIGDKEMICTVLRVCIHLKSFLIFKYLLLWITYHYCKLG